MTREVLAMRREAESFEVFFDTQAEPFVVTVGRYPDGRPAEIFINAAKRDQLFDHLARDTAVLISLALQFGADVDALGKALTRDGAGKPLGLAGAVLDAISEVAA